MSILWAILQLPVAIVMCGSLQGEVVLGRINCDSSRKCYIMLIIRVWQDVISNIGVLCQSMFHITKYPTLKLLRNGQSAKKEYRGQVELIRVGSSTWQFVSICIPQRSITALSDYVKGQLADPVKEYTGGEAMGKLVCSIAESFSCADELHAYSCTASANVTHSSIV